MLFFYGENRLFRVCLYNRGIYIKSFIAQHSGLESKIFATEFVIFECYVRFT